MDSHTPVFLFFSIHTLHTFARVNRVFGTVLPARTIFIVDDRVPNRIWYFFIVA